jgi:hypothetical protein
MAQNHQLPSFHDHYINGYRVNGRARTIHLELARPDEDRARAHSVTITFSGVEGYLLEHDLGVNIVYSIEEQPLTQFIEENASAFVEGAKWGWPLFWKGSVESTIAWLTQRAARAWALSTSYGLFGWVVAREATQEGHA